MVNGESVLCRIIPAPEETGFWEGVVNEEGVGQSCNVLFCDSYILRHRFGLKKGNWPNANLPNSLTPFRKKILLCSELGILRLDLT